MQKNTPKNNKQKKNVQKQSKTEENESSSISSLQWELLYIYLLSVSFFGKLILKHIASKIIRGMILIVRTYVIN